MQRKAAQDQVRRMPILLTRLRRDIGITRTRRFKG